MNNKIREGSRIADIIMYAALVVICFIVIYPLWYVLILSLSDPAKAMTMKVYTVPYKFNIQSYASLVKNNDMWHAYAVTIFYAVTTTLLMLVTSSLTAYPLTNRNLVGRRYVTTFLLIPMFISGGMIPSYLLIHRLGLYDSPLALIIPACYSTGNIILVKAYFSTIPETLRESAYIDGANSFQILARIYLPMAVPILAVVAVYTIVGVWNSWFSALLYLPHKEWQPLQLYLRRVIVADSRPINTLPPEVAAELAKQRISAAQMQYAMIIFCAAPMLLIYPFFQKFFIRGVMLGSLKG